MTEERHRPNEKYKLSRPDDGKDPYGEDQLVFHYDRQRRLEKAPKAVRDLYAVTKKRRFGFFASLVGDRPRRILFIMIIVMCVMIYVLSALGKFDNSYSLEGNEIEASAEIYEGNTIIVLNKIITGEDAYYGAVNIAVSPVAENPENTADDSVEDRSVFYHRVFFNPENEESYSFTVPFSVPELLLLLQTERSEVGIKLKL